MTAQIILAGIAQGCLYGLIALGFVLIYKATETFNFAQGEFMMLGAFAAFAASSILGWPIWVAALVAVAVLAALGIAVERLFIRPILGQPALSVVILTLGLAYAARSAVTMIPAIGTDTHELSVPYKGIQFKAMGVVLTTEQVVVIAATASLCLALYLMFRFTRLGVAMQATSQNQLAAYYMGIPVRHLNGLVWGLAAGIAAVAGLLLAPFTFVHAHMGFIGLKALPAAIVGGFGSLPGAIAGGLVVGLAESLSGYFLPQGFKDVAPYLVVLLVLIVKPTGLFGESARKKV